MMKRLHLFPMFFLALSLCGAAQAQIGSYPPTGSTFSGAQTICLYSNGTCGTNLPNTDIFYTLDGTPATEASTWYPCASSTTGCITIPAPTGNETVTINAVLVQTTNTTLTSSRTAKM